MNYIIGYEGRFSRTNEKRYPNGPSQRRFRTEEQALAELADYKQMYLNDTYYYYVVQDADSWFRIERGTKFVKKDVPMEKAASITLWGKKLKRVYS